MSQTASDGCTAVNWIKRKVHEAGQQHANCAIKSWDKRRHNYIFQKNIIIIIASLISHGVTKLKKRTTNTKCLPTCNPIKDGNFGTQDEPLEIIIETRAGLSKSIRWFMMSYVYIYIRKKMEIFWNFTYTIVARRGGANRERKPHKKMKMCFNGFRAKNDKKKTQNIP